MRRYHGIPAAEPKGAPAHALVGVYRDDNKSELHFGTPELQRLALATPYGTATNVD
jgi:hypothetical protein